MKDQELKEMQIALLQLQRSALIDTQTIMQILLDKGICELDDIIDTRAKIESQNKDVERIDHQILEYGGQVVQTPHPEGLTKREAIQEQLKSLQELIAQMSK